MTTNLGEVALGIAAAHIGGLEQDFYGVEMRLYLKVFSTASLLLVTILTGACGVLTWRNVYTSEQPHGDQSVQVAEMCGLADCSIRIVVSQGWRSRQIAYRRGCILGFAEIAWQGTRAGIFVDGQTCQQLRIAYDFRSHTEIPFQEAKESVAKAIMQDYKVDSGELREFAGDVFRWATYDSDRIQRSIKEFRKRYRK